MINIQKKIGLCLPVTTPSSHSCTWLGRTVHYLKGLLEGIASTVNNFIKKYFGNGLNTLFKTEGNSSCLYKDLEELSPKKATYHLLTTPGFMADLSDKETNFGFKGEVQGSKKLRFVAAKVLGLYPHAISPQALREQKHHNLEQYLTLKIKRFAHAFSLKGCLTLPSGKDVNLEGFSEVFTIPMIASSFEEFARNSPIFSTKETNWIVQQLNQTTKSDYLKRGDIQRLSSRLQHPDFIGPISLGSGFDWHSTSTIFFGDFMLFCNRGRGAEGKPGVHIYSLSQRRQSNETMIWKIAKRQKIREEDSICKEFLAAKLGGNLVHFEKMSGQEVGNCTYVSMETALFVLMAIYRLKDVPQDQIDAARWQEAFESVRPVYQQWWDFDRELIMQDMIKEIQEWKEQREAGLEDNNLFETYREVLNYWYRYHGTSQPVPLPMKHLLKYFRILH